MDFIDLFMTRTFGPAALFYSVPRDRLSFEISWFVDVSMFLLFFARTYGVSLILCGLDIICDSMMIQMFFLMWVDNDGEMIGSWWGE